MTRRLDVLVTGATGRQGGALARALLERGHGVRALTRTPDSAAAGELRRRGAEVVAGDFNDGAGVERAARGMDAVFVMGTPYEAGPEVEARLGLDVVDAVVDARVKHLVYSSVASADRQTGIPSFDSKLVVERRILEDRVPFTIVRPAFFMENLRSPAWLPALEQGLLPMALPAGRALQQVAAADVGRFLALVLERREEFQGKRIDIASDEISGAEVAKVLSRIMGQPIRFVQVPLEELRAGDPGLARMFGWLDEVGFDVDIAGIRRAYPEVGWHSFERWARAQDWGDPARRAPVVEPPSAG